MIFIRRNEEENTEIAVRSAGGRGVKIFIVTHKISYHIYSVNNIYVIDISAVNVIFLFCWYILRKFYFIIDFIKFC